VKPGAETIPAIVIPDLAVAYQIPALNTEKVHNLRDKALEVIRMYRGKLADNPGAAEKELRIRVRTPAFRHLSRVLNKELPIASAENRPQHPA